MTLKPLVFVAILLSLDAMIYGAAPRSSRDHALRPTGDSAAARPRRRGDAAPAQRRISERTVLAPSYAGAPRKEGRGRFGTSGDIWVARACRRPGPFHLSTSARCAPQGRDVCRHGPPGRRRYTPLFSRQTLRPWKRDDEDSAFSHAHGFSVQRRRPTPRTQPTLSVSARASPSCSMQRRSRSGFDASRPCPPRKTPPTSAKPLPPSTALTWTSHALFASATDPRHGHPSQRHSDAAEASAKRTDPPPLVASDMASATRGIGVSTTSRSSQRASGMATRKKAK